MLVSTRRHGMCVRVLGELTIMMMMVLLPMLAAAAAASGA
jgi:hypothetical protein